MKAGILTFHESSNYGAQLQTYALQTVIENLSIECEIINYHSLSKESRNRSTSILVGLNKMLSSNIIKRNQLNADKFLHENLHLSKKRFQTKSELLNCVDS